MEEARIIEEVRHWLTTMVVGLGLCPFADKPNRAGTIRYAVCPSADPAELLVSLVKELPLLARSDRAEVETTLLIAPAVYPDFLDFNDFMGEAEDALEKLGLTGVIQLVAFHPQFRFAGVPDDAPENYTNRSPYPLLHLLREISVTEASETYPDLSEIPKRNTATLRKLGLAALRERLGLR